MIMSTLMKSGTKIAQPWETLSLQLYGARLANAFLDAIANYVAHRALRRAEAQLAALDDRTLKDIGLDRSEIRSVLLDQANERRTRAKR
jgi:uncharacterized protein YjiS (DUF1127 family)